jgi:hypothetical protein
LQPEGPGLALAAKAATATIPIAFTGGVDLVEHGLVASLSRPDGNATGSTNVSDELAPKRLELLHEMVPKATAIGMLMNPNFPGAETEARQVQRGALTLGLQLHILSASTEGDFDTAFACFINQRVGALAKTGFQSARWVVRGRGIVALQDARSAPSRVHSQIHPLSPVEAIAASAPGANITIPPRSSKTKFCRCHRRSCLFVLSLDIPMISLR